MTIKVLIAALQRLVKSGVSGDAKVYLCQILREHESHGEESRLVPDVTYRAEIVSPVVAVKKENSVYLHAQG